MPLGPGNSPGPRRRGLTLPGPAARLPAPLRGPLTSVWGGLSGEPADKSLNGKEVARFTHFGEELEIWENVRKLAC